MARLLAETPLGGRDVTRGGTRLREVDCGRITWIAPYPGETTAVSHALQASISLAFPEPGEARDSAAGRILWSGRAQALLIGPEAPAVLAGHAAILDHTEAWAALELTGVLATETLARLVPIDLRPSAFPPGRTARSLLGHMNAQIMAIPAGFELLVMRSMAQTAAHEIESALRAVAARRTL